MKTVVITGSAKGLGFEMAKVFRENNLNVVLSDLNKDKLQLAKKELEKIIKKSIEEQRKNSYKPGGKNYHEI